MVRQIRLEGTVIVELILEGKMRLLKKIIVFTF